MNKKKRTSKKELDKSVVKAFTFACIGIGLMIVFSSLADVVKAFNQPLLEAGLRVLSGLSIFLMTPIFLALYHSINLDYEDKSDENWLLVYWIVKGLRDHFPQPDRDEILALIDKRLEEEQDEK